MTDTPIPPVRDCGRYVPGHTIHWIQARLTWKDPQPRTAVEIVHIGDSFLVMAADGGLRRFSNHDLPRLRAAVDHDGPYGALVGYHALRLESGHLVCVKEDTEGPLEPCVGLCH